MSRRRLKKALTVKKSEISTPVENTCSRPPEQEQTAIVVTGFIYDGSQKSQEILVRHIPGKQIGEIFWAAIEIVKRIGGLVEETPEGVNFYPVDIFDGGLHFAAVKANAIKQ